MASAANTATASGSGTSGEPLAWGGDSSTSAGGSAGRPAGTGSVFDVLRDASLPAGYVYDVSSNTLPQRPSMAGKVPSAPAAAAGTTPSPTTVTSAASGGGGGGEGEGGGAGAATTTAASAMISQSRTRLVAAATVEATSESVVVKFSVHASRDEAEHEFNMLNLLRDSGVTPEPVGDGPVHMGTNTVLIMKRLPGTSGLQMLRANTTHAALPIQVRNASHLATTSCHATSSHA